jgi:hypothetical protein
LDVAGGAQRNPEEIAHADFDRHPHAVDGTTQHNAFAMKFDISYAPIRAYVMRVEADR